MKSIRRILMGFLLVLAMLDGGLLPAVAATGGYPYANYSGPGTNPSQYWWTDASGSGWSPYGYAYRNCTDYAAWKLRSANGFTDTAGYGNAYQWGGRAAGRGYTVNMTPAPGAIAWWGQNAYGMSSYGHVAWVYSVSGDNVVVQEYNNPGGGYFGQRTINRNHVSGYIHFKDLASPSEPAVPPALPSQPASVSWEQGRIDTFVQGADGRLYTRVYDDKQGGWQPWSGALFPHQLTSGPAVASWGVGRLDVFARGAGGDLLHAWYSANTWHQFESLGGQIVGAPAAVSWGNGRIDVFSQGADNKMWQTFYDVSGDGQWHWATPLNQSLFSSPAVASWGPGRLDVFFRGPAGDLVHQWLNGSTWYPVESLGNAISGQPAAVSWEPGRLDVFAQGADSNLKQIFYDGQWHSFSFNQSIFASPTVASWAPGRLDVFFRGPARDLVHVWLADEQWHPAESLGGQMN